MEIHEKENKIVKMPGAKANILLNEINQIIADSASEFQYEINNQSKKLYADKMRYAFFESVKCIVEKDNMDDRSKLASIIAVFQTLDERIKETENS